MNAIMTVLNCGNYTVHEPLSGNVRNYFLSVESELWDYGPSGLNMYDGGSLTESGRFVFVFRLFLFLAIYPGFPHEETMNFKTLFKHPSGASVPLF